jgi:probable rRNA maturation factor
MPRELRRPAAIAMTPEGQRRHSTRLSVVVGNERGRAPVARGLSRWLTHIAPARARGTVSLAIVSDHRVRALNRQYRGLDAATDVLSFPEEDATTRTPSVWRASSRSRAQSRFLGEIVIARGVAKRQARAAGHSESTELRVLALHGLLHLIGYDHETDRGVMRRIERRLRRKGGLPGGLIDRAAPPRAGRR